MESDDDLHLSSPSSEAPLPVPRKLKRLKRAIRVSHDPDLKQSDGVSVSSEANSSRFESKNSESNQLHSSLGSRDFSCENFQSFKESDGISRSRSGSEDFDSEMDFGYTGLGAVEGGSGAKRALDFGKVDVEREEEDGVRRNEVEEENHNEELVVSENKRHISDDIEEEKDKEDEKEKEKKKKRRVESGVDDGRPKEAAKNKRRAEKERRDHLKQLHAESQRLLRESRNATFEPVPLVQKPISSLLEKIRQRRLEISKNRRPAVLSNTSFIDNDDGDSEELIVEHNSECAHAEGGGCGKVSEVASKETIAHPAEVESNIDGPLMDGHNSIATIPVYEKNPSQALNEESKQAFRVPVDDTQDLFSDTQTSESKDEILDEMPSSPLEEVLAPSVLTLNLKFDSAPPDDVSSDDEDNDKENVEPRQQGPANLSTTTNGDPVKAFVDDEAEEEDDSDNDISRFQENDEDEDEDEDLEELNDMIATGYEEKPIDAERRNELHQKWLEQQDAAGTETLMQKFKHGSELCDATCLEEEEDGGEEDEEFEDGAAEDSVPRNEVQMNLRKIKQMIPQMYTDNDNGYLSSDDEETEKCLAKHCLIEKVEAQSMFLSPAEDESCKDVFGLIKKLNIVPDTKKRAKMPGRFDMPFIGGKGNVSSKSSFLGRGSSQSLPSFRKRGSITSRSFIFGTDDSNSRSTISTSEDSSEMIQRESRPRIASAKFSSSQTKGSTQSSTPASVVKSNTSLIEILRQTSLKSKSFIQESAVIQTETVLASFKLAKKTVKTREDPILYTRT